MTNQHLEALLAAAAAARAFGHDVRRIIRRVLAAGVRLGATELVQSRRGQEIGQHEEHR
ncbi:hypothetical protein [Actinacidiphila yanglinensis]|uniref:hypothetical protein n=1 Tax=Actinacidiphila yanglinensis TaxID=310779 RepID=UPI001357F1C8|nr:hypothetical protein [Actinacidiphila yanglinensis]